MTDAAVFQPSWASPPGETMRDLIASRNVSLTELEASLNLSSRKIGQLLEGGVAITPAMAKKIAAVLGRSNEFWMHREMQYRTNLLHLKSETRTWLRNIPLRDMVKFGWVSDASSIEEKIRSVFQFFDVSSVDEWRWNWLSDAKGLTAFRTSPTFVASAVAIAAWLRRGEVIAGSTHCEPWSAESLRDSLPSLKALTRLKNPNDFLPKLQLICAKCGVAIVVVRAPKGCTASGATRFMSPDKAIIQLSFRYLSDDHFWFTFFHEVGHLLLHEERLFLEGAEVDLTAVEEVQANQFASDLLLPNAHIPRLNSLGSDPRRIMRYARDLGISPGILVGQMQHRGILHPSRLNYLKKRFKWA